MKKLSLLFILLMTSILYYSCETDVSIIDEYEDITIVYGVLNPLDDTTFIKVSKAFLGEGSALTYASIEDSNSYENILLTLTPFENNVDDEPIVLEPIDINSKDDGLFYSPHQVVYYTTEEILVEKDYRLEVHVGDKIVSAETPLVQSFSIDRPSAGGSYINFLPDFSGQIEWTTPRNGKRYETLIRFKYFEITVNYEDTIHKSFDWILPSTTSRDADGGEDLISVYDNNQFYVMVEDRIPYANEADEDRIIFRGVEKIEFYVFAAAEDLNTYIEVNEPSNSIVQDRPEYTNVENGYGIFSSRFMKKRERMLHATSYGILDGMDLKFDFDKK